MRAAVPGLLAAIAALGGASGACDGGGAAPDAAGAPLDGAISSDGPAGGADAPPAPPDAPPAADASPCPGGMALVAGGAAAPACMDRLEAPNAAGARPLVMYTLLEAEAWCGARGKRLCFDDEWLAACEGAAGWAYPYGDAREPGRCNDEETWRAYDQTRLNAWPPAASAADVESLDALLAAASAVSPSAAGAAEHVAALYQGEGGGVNAGCVGPAGVLDLVGNVEEWTRRRDGGAPSFHGALKGRYWAESRTCQSAVTTHGDGFRFYEIGFRCCRDAP